jgi:4a-hydroxytetrahydrobiopterin dehydratase
MYTVGKCLTSTNGLKIFTSPKKSRGMDLNQLKNKRCKPCEGGVCPLDREDSVQHLDQLPGWQLAADNKSIVRMIRFRNFSETMSFINAMAEMAEQQDHHPDFSAGYAYCEVRYSTHAIAGLSENDFICAAKISSLLES